MASLGNEKKITLLLLVSIALITVYLEIASIDVYCLAYHGYSEREITDISKKERLQESNNTT